MQSPSFFSLKQVIDRQPLTVAPQTLLTEVIRLMQEWGNSCNLSDNIDPAISDAGSNVNNSCVLITQNKRLLGIFTERDLVKLIAAKAKLDNVTVAEVMNRNIVTLSATDKEDLFTALAKLRQHRIRHLPVLDKNNNFLGLITAKNLRQQLQPVNLMQWRKVSEVMKTKVVCAAPDDSVRHIASLMAESEISCVAIAESKLDRQTKNSFVHPVGIITERDIVQFQNLALDFEQPARNLMSTPLFLVSPEDTLWSVHQQMQQRRVRRLLVGNERGELQGIITQTSLLEIFDPTEMYGIIEVLQRQVCQLELEKTRSLENRQSELEQQITKRTAALETTNRRLQLEASLRQQNEARFDSILSSLEDVVYSVAPDTFKVIYINAAVEKIYGRQVAEFYDAPNLWLEVVHPEDRDRAVNFAENVLATGSEEIEYRIIRPDGEVRWLYDRATLIRNAAGTPVRIDGIATDISDRVSAEAALRESEQRFRNMADNAPMMVWVTDATGYCIYLSQSWYEFTGQTEATGLGLGWLEAVHPEDRPRARAVFLYANERQEAFQIDYRLRRHNGEYCWAIDAAKPRIGDGGQFKGYIGSVIDISDRKQAELEIRKFVSLADNSSEFIGMCDPNFVPFYINKAGKQLVGLNSLKEYAEVSVGDFFFPEDRDFILNEFFPQIMRQGRGEIEIRFRHFQTGAAIWMIYSVHSIEDENGNSIALATLSRDISDRKRREEILKDIATGITVPTGTDFLPSLVKYLCKTLGVDFAFIGELVQPDRDRIQTLAVYGKGRVGDNFEYSIADTPCQNVIEHEICVYSAGVKQQFPQDPMLQKMNAESYAGITIIDATNKCFGLIAILDRQPFADVPLIEEVLKIFATRVTTELERQQAESQIRQQAALLDLTHDTVLVRNLDNIITFWNLGAEKMYGWSADEALGKKSHELLQAKFSQPLTEIETELFQQGHWEGELTHQKRDGTTVIVMGRWSLLRDEAGNPQQILEINHDITQRKQAEEKIREQAALLDITTDAIMIRGLDDKILYWNRGAEKMYGWTKAEALNKNGYELLYRKYPTELSKVQQATTEQGEWQGELVQVTKADRDIVVQSRWSLVRDEAGNPFSYLVVKSDITEQKQLETQFLRTQRLESLGTLAGGIAHDLNNILAPILGFSKLLPLKLPDVDKQTKDFFKIMETNAQRGTALVKQILTFSRGLEGDRGIVQMRHLIAEIGQIVRETFPKSIELSVDVSKNLWTINADVNQLHQVLMNLCVNARDAMPEGGELTITAENLRVDAEYARLHLDATEGSHISITVADTGVGIPPEIIDRIFEPFFTTKEIGRGTGLGLSTVIGIVKSHGGFVDVTSDSRSGRGTRFSIFLPASEAAASSTEAEPAILQGNGELILVVDDETPMLSVTKATLETYNYRVLTANNGIEAIATYAKERAIALVIMDIMMPVMEGKTAIRTLRRINPELNIIAVSGLITSKEIVAELNGEVRAFLAKPYTNEDLLRKIAEIINE